MAREVGEQRSDRVGGFCFAVDDERSDATGAAMYRGAAEGLTVDGDPRELRDRIGTAHVGEGVGSHHDDVDETEEQRGSGDARPDHREDRRDDTRRVGQETRDATPPVEGGDIVA